MGSSVMANHTSGVSYCLRQNICGAPFWRDGSRDGDRVGLSC